MSQWSTFKIDGETATINDRIISVGESVKSGLGSIEFRKTQKTGLHMVRLSGSGRFKYALPLSKDGTYRMGPSWGHRVKDPVEEKNPLIRVCRELEIPISNVNIVMGKTLDGVEVTVGGSHCQHSTTDSNSWLDLHTDGNATNVTEPETVQSHMNQYHVGCICSTWTQVIRGGTWAVITLRKTRCFAGVSKVIVAGEGCDPETLRLAIKGDGDPKVGAELFAQEKAKKEGHLIEYWAARISSGKTPVSFEIGGMEYKLYFNSCFKEVRARDARYSNGLDCGIFEILRREGLDPVAALPAPQQQLAQALSDPEKGCAWLKEKGYDKCFLLPAFGAPERLEVWLAIEDGELKRVSGHAPYHATDWFAVIENHGLNRAGFGDSASGGELRDKAVTLSQPDAVVRMEEKHAGCLWRHADFKPGMVDVWNR
jgi:hypothetical protein